MDGAQFDTFLKGLTVARSRRGAVVGLVGALAGLIDLGASRAKHKKKKKKKAGSPPVSPPSPPAGCPESCPVCQQCVDGQTCTPRPNGIVCGNNECTSCQSGACVPRPNNTSCNAGQ